MKVILLKDIRGVGKKYDVKDVSDGHALNFLIPQGGAESATPKALKRAEVMKSAEAAERKIQEDLLAKNLADVGSVSVNLSEKANEKGHLFAQIHAPQLSKAIKEQTRLDIPSEFIILEKPIKEIGDHLVEVKVGGKSAKFKVVVTAA